MPTPRPEITSHEFFRLLSQDFFKPYPPYVLVNSPEDAKSTLLAGCEPGYLLALDTSSPPGTKSLKSNEIKEFQGRVGIIIFTLPLDTDLAIIANKVLEVLEVGGTAIGFATAEQSTEWKRVCLEWAKMQQAENIQGQEQDGIIIEWSASDAKLEEWLQWSLVKKEPEWAFC